MDELTPSVLTSGDFRPPALEPAGQLNRSAKRESEMAGGAGGNHPDPDEIERRLRELNKEIGRPPVHEPSSLERLVAAKKAEKKVQRKRDTRVLTARRRIRILSPRRPHSGCHRTTRT